jgi:periplasmic divalent cation tolerance protein
MATDVVILLSTFPDHNTARTAACTLVEESLVACGNLLSGVESIYRWKGEVETSAEVLVIFKTTMQRADEAMLRLRGLHPYDVPEILRIGVEDGWPDYLKWVRENVVAGQS